MSVRKTIWSFGLFKTTLLTWIPPGIGILLVVASQPEGPSAYRNVAVVASLLLLALWIRVLAFPVLSLRQETVSGPITCVLWGLLPVRKIEFELDRIAANSTRLRLVSGGQTFQTVLMTYEAGPKHWRLGGSRSELRMRQLEAEFRSARGVNLGTLD